MFFVKWFPPCLNGFPSLVSFLPSLLRAKEETKSKVRWSESPGEMSGQEQAEVRGIVRIRDKEQRAGCLQQLRNTWKRIASILFHMDVLSCSFFPEGGGNEKADSLLGSEEAHCSLTVCLLLQKDNGIALWSWSSIPLFDTCIG